MEKIEDFFDPGLGVISTDCFSKLYPVVNSYMINNIDFSQSRDGMVKELLDVKTMLKNPYNRCVGGYKRNINIFFLLVEAMWIVLGRKDVKTLINFNGNMKNFSDDGETFHAPYGFRLRHWGVRTEDKYEDGVSVAQGTDQVINAIRLLTENPNTRQVVMSIWNPNFDLGFKTKDIPCNDMIMLKIRGGKLITTIQNRSNDLHWGLPTNIFQFSFLTEIMSSCLGITLGTQTHNSQSLHIYDWNDIANVMYKEYTKNGFGLDLYKWVKPVKMDFNFSHEVPANRFREIEYNLSLIIDNINRVCDGEEENNDEIRSLEEFSHWLYVVYLLLKIYIGYKENIKNSKDDMYKDEVRIKCISDIESIEKDNDMQEWDISALAKNFFAARLHTYKTNYEYIGKL